ncbi:outer membrane beta-barrel protein [Solimicrobium silvestre]|uniref:Outer membrane protein beta-barrel domain n=1 Tax=Solimicrobium silvestre TaxID=2099400 RepID=A0A2S9H2A5_9BURK|nr:outer membrane beta-barrel protein [Solimicrobium silvestre]PRC94112.1 Outer membrane protein beta-barrel domain [Solimicrobium silvestre]
MKRNIIATVLAVAGLMLGASAQAQVYVGGTVGESFWNTNCSGTTNCSTNDSGYKMLGGYNINSHWGVEATYFSVGKITANVGEINGEIKGTGADIAGVYRTNFGSSDWGMFAKLGFGSTKGEVIASEGTFTNSITTRTTEPVVGFGVTYAVNESFKLVADIDSRSVKVTVPGTTTSGGVVSLNIGAQVSF